MYDEKLMQRYIAMGARFILAGGDLGFLMAGAAIGRNSSQDRRVTRARPGRLFFREPSAAQLRGRRRRPPDRATGITMFAISRARRGAERGRRRLAAQLGVEVDDRLIAPA